MTTGTRSSPFGIFVTHFPFVLPSRTGRGWGWVLLLPLVAHRRLLHAPVEIRPGAGAVVRRPFNADAALLHGLVTRKEIGPALLHMRVVHHAPAGPDDREQLARVGDLVRRLHAEAG